MFTFATYKIVHLLGVFLLFLSMGNLLGHAANGGDKQSNKMRGLSMAFHGSSLVLLLVAGFGMLAKGGISFGGNPWIHIKLTIWLIMGALVVVPGRFPQLARPVFLVMPVLGLISAWLAIAKPFAAAVASP